MTTEEQNMLGRLSAQLDDLSHQQELTRTELRGDIKELSGMVNNMNAEGCAKGKQHTKDIEDLKQRPERMIGIGAALIAIFSAVGSFALWFVSRSH